jgi:hypothetical protein
MLVNLKWTALQIWSHRGRERGWFQQYHTGQRKPLPITGPLKLKKPADQA